MQASTPSLTPKFYSTREEAIESGQDEDSLVTLSWRNDEERDALALAAQHGNREARRHRFDNHRPPGAADLTEGQRNKRNAARRLAKKQRKINRKK